LQHGHVVRLSKLYLLPQLLGKRFRNQRRPEGIKLCLLCIRQRGHQQQIVLQRVIRAECPQPPRPLSKHIRVRQPDTRNIPLGERLNLGGI